MSMMQAHCLRKACLQVSKAEYGMVRVTMKVILMGWLPESFLVEHGLVTYPGLVPSSVRQHH